MKDRAKAEGKPLFTIDIDRRHCAGLQDDERGRITLQGPANGMTNEAVTRLILKLSGCSQESIDEVCADRVWEAALPVTNIVE